MTDAQTALLLAHIYLARLTSPLYSFVTGLLFLLFYIYMRWFQ